MTEYILRNEQKVIIRRAVKEDATAFIDYLNKIGGESDYLTFGGNEIKISIDEEENYIQYMSNSKNRLFLMAEINGKIAGSLSFTGGTRPRVYHTGEFGITVLKEFWGLGLGSLLIQNMINWARESRLVNKINLRTREDNEVALRLYKKMGFVQEGIITRDFFIDGKFYDSILMGMKID